MPPRTVTKLGQEVLCLIDAHGLPLISADDAAILLRWKAPIVSRSKRQAKEAATRRDGARRARKARQRARRMTGSSPTPRDHGTVRPPPILPRLRSVRPQCFANAFSPTSNKNTQPSGASFSNAFISFDTPVTAEQHQQQPLLEWLDEVEATLERSTQPSEPSHGIVANSPHIAALGFQPVPQEWQQLPCEPLYDESMLQLYRYHHSGGDCSFVNGITRQPISPPAGVDPLGEPHQSLHEPALFPEWPDMPGPVPFFFDVPPALTNAPAIPQDGTDLVAAAAAAPPLLRSRVSSVGREAWDLGVMPLEFSEPRVV